jgi:parallel beta-helix repeat protein
MTTTVPLHRPRLLVELSLLGLVAATLTVLPSHPAAAATTWFVDGASASCTDTAAGGTQSTPFCTITAAAKKALTPGDSVTVAPATYREQVTVAASGTAASPITFTATGPGVIVLGTQDVSDPATWTATGTSAWSRPFAPPSAPRQVFVDGSRLASATSATSTTTGSFFYDAITKILYVDAGGANPAVGHTIEAGAQTYGFNVATRTGISIDGFDLRRQNSAGVRVLTSSAVTVLGVSVTESGVNGVLVDSSTTSDVVVRGCHVSGSASVGIRVTNSVGTTVRDCTSNGNGFHGFALNASRSVVLRGNVSYDNRVVGGTSTAAGFDVNNLSTDAVVTGNSAYGNQDSGIQVYNGSDRALVARNASWSNGDHGIDTNKSVSVSYLSNTVTANRKDGLSIEGNSSGATVANNIALDNGTGVGEYDLWIDPGSVPGTVADHDLVWNPSTAPVAKVGTTVYATVADLTAATGLEAHGLAVDPRLVDPASGDLRLRPGSPATDAADTTAPGFVTNDRDGTEPVDDVSVPDTGSGSPSYADLGAYELVPPAGGPVDYPPNAALVVSPTAGEVPPAFLVTADASGSSDPDQTGLASFTVDFGDGTVVGPQSSPRVDHAYSSAGTFTVTASVRDQAGQVSTASRTVRLSTHVPVSYVVDGADPACSDAAAGTSAAPLCTVSAGAALARAGDTVVVRPAVYREQVTAARSGAPGFDLTFRASGPGVVISGTRDVTDPTAWSPTATTAWSRSYSPPSPPTQVWLDGSSLQQVPDAASLIAGAFFYDTGSKLLYVDNGGGNPGTGHTVEAGAQTYAFKVWASDHVVIDGFAVDGQNNTAVSLKDDTATTLRGLTITRSGTYGISADNVSGGSVLTLNEVSGSGSVGIRLVGSTGVTVRDNVSHDNAFHGISLQGSSGNNVVGNTAYRNVRPLVRSANGIDLQLGSSNNVVDANTTYGNQDSGIQVYSGSTGNIVRRNVTHDNGDHGIDVLSSTGAVLISNTAWRNAKDGVSVEGPSTGATLRNNILVDNGITTGEYDLYVDDAALAGFSSDRDLIWNSTTAPAVKHNLVIYSTLLAYRTGTGQEAAGKAADPRFADAASGDLRLTGRSPAIDAADSTVLSFRADDRTGNSPVDDPVVANSGAGVPPWADLGAYEYRGPVARLTLTPTQGFDPFVTTASAASSTTLGAAVAGYAFDFGDGSKAGPQATPTASHTYLNPGTYVVTVTVTSTDGQWDTATATATVLRDAPPVARLVLKPAADYVPFSLTADASTSTDTSGTPISTFRFDCGNGTVVGPQAANKTTCSYSIAGTYTVRVTVTDTAGHASTVSAVATARAEEAPTARLNAPNGTVKPNTNVTLDASGSTDPDKTPIASYRFTCGNGVTIPAQSSPRATCRYPATGTYVVTVVVTDTIGQTGTAQDTVRVK